MKIAYLNPWSSAAENQCYGSLAIVAQRKGVELIDCRNEIDLEASGAEFVISHTSCVPKISDHPTYLIVHEPPSRFRENGIYFRNLLTYDGYLTIADSVRRFLHGVNATIGRRDTIGYFYTTAQKSDTRTPILEIIREGNLRVVYFGTNWDRRVPKLFEILDPSGIFRIHGPTHSWPTGLKSYFGPLPFDGVAPQMTYASFGIGLILLSTDHLREDVITNRIFEISSVGAVSICPDIPWIRKSFGELVFYFDPAQPTKDIASRIVDIHEYCKAYPRVAARMGEEARAIFERDFAEEVLLPKAIDCHNDNKRARSRRRSALGRPPLIAVILRCGDRNIEYAKRAIKSVGTQSFGRYALIIVKSANIDPSEILSNRPTNVEFMAELVVPNGNRNAILVTGLTKLRELAAEYFAVLDANDFWLSDHMENLFCAGERASDDFDVIFSGYVDVSSEGQEIERGLLWKRNVNAFGFGGDFRSGEFSPNCFVARTDCLSGGVDVVDMKTAEDSLIISLLARCHKPIFSYQATAFHTREAFASNSTVLGFKQQLLAVFDALSEVGRYNHGGARFWFDKNDPLVRDLREIASRYGCSIVNEGFPGLVDAAGNQNNVAPGERIVLLTSRREDSIILANAAVSNQNLLFEPLARREIRRPGVVFTIVVTNVKVDASRYEAITFPQPFSMELPSKVVLPPQPFAWGARFPLQFQDLMGPLWICIQATVHDGPIALGILDEDGGDFLSRTVVDVPGDSTVNLLVPKSQQFGDLVVQNWDKAKPTSVTIDAVTVFKPCAINGPFGESPGASSDIPVDLEEIHNPFGPPVVPGTNISQEKLSAAICTSSQPFAFAAQFPLKIPDLKGPLWIRIRTNILGGPVAIGVLNQDGSDLLSKIPVVASGDTTIVLRVKKHGIGDLVIQSCDKGQPARVRVESTTVLMPRPRAGRP